MTAIVTNINSTIGSAAQALVDANAGLSGAKTACTTLLNASVTDAQIQFWTVVQGWLNSNSGLITTSSASYPFWTFSDLGTY